MRLSDLTRTTALRWAFTCAAIFALGLSLFATLIYRETAGYLTRRVNSQLQGAAYTIAIGPLSDQLEDVGEYLETDPGQFKVAGLFDASGHPMAGNLRALPAGLPRGRVIETRLSETYLGPGALAAADPTLIRSMRRHPAHGLSVRLLLVPLEDGRSLLVGIDAQVVHQVEQILSRALWLTLPPMLLLALVAAWIVTRGALRRIAQVHESSRRIMAGQLHERLPVRGTRDDFDQLSASVNSMLDEIERLLLETRGVGEGIAHDMRTPLTRLRARLERALEDPKLTAATAALLAAGIGDIDQTLGTIRALLRIAEVEHGARRAAFAVVDLGRIVGDAVELYEPIALEKGVVLRMELLGDAAVVGDRDLLFEAIANLIDNAIKFSPAGAEVLVRLGLADSGPFMRVADNGPGIAPEDWAHLTRRFFRSDRSRHTLGNGLGLSLVAAIVRLHEFGLVLNPTSRGCCVELECWPHAAQMILQIPNSAAAILASGVGDRAAPALPLPAGVRMGVTPSAAGGVR